jgi:hypothetical protein
MLIVDMEGIALTHYTSGGKEMTKRATQGWPPFKGGSTPI